MTIAETHAATTGITSTEWSLITDTAAPQTATNDACVQVFLDLSALGIGDKYRFRIKEKVRATGIQRVVAQHTFANVQARPIWASPTLILLHGWDVTLQKLAGVDRAIDFSVREMSQTSPGSTTPTIASFTPSSGDAGDTITITGTNFNGVSQVLIGTTPASLTIVNDTTITTTVPTGMTPGDYNITVATPSASAVSSTTFHVATFSGSVTLTSDYLVGTGQVAEWDPFVTTTVTIQNKNFIVDGGTMRMRPTSASIVHTLQFTGINEAAFVGGGDVPLSTDIGLWVVGNSTFDVRGTPRSGWKRAPGGVSAGATSLTLDSAPTGWLVGDEIVVVPTALGNFTGFETKTLTSSSGASLGWSGGLTQSHPAVPAPVNLGPEVANLTRNVVIQGEATGRGHIFMRTNGPQTAGYFTIRHMGVPIAGTDLGGRYALHLHGHGLTGEEMRGSAFTGIVIRDGGRRGVVTHHAHGVTHTDYVLYGGQNAALWWDTDTPDTDDNASNDTVYDHMLVANWNLLNQPREAAIHLNKGLRNAATECTVVGFISPQKQANGFGWAEQQGSTWIFRNCVAHNNPQIGALIWQNSEHSHDSPGYIAYRNGKFGILHGAYSTFFDWNALLYENLRSLDFHAGAGNFLGPQTWRVTGANQITTNVHSLPFPEPTLFENITFVGHTGTFCVFTDQQGNHPALMDFCGCTTNGSDLEVTDFDFALAMIGTTVRVQRGNGTAWRAEKLANGTVSTTSIAAFCA